MSLLADAPRAAGVLLHPTSLPGPHGVGELGVEARRFLDWMSEAGASFWQVLPLVPPGSGHSPYATPAALAMDPRLIDPRELVAWGLLDRVPDAPAADSLDRADFDRTTAWKSQLVRAASARLHARPDHPLRPALAAFRAEADWVEETALFLALRAARRGEPWWRWPAPLRDRDPGALAAARETHAHAIEDLVTTQFLVERQWQALRAYASARGIRVIGDLPIYVDRDSADVWAARDQFQLHPDGTPRAVAGVPPDYFSATGQLWGNPLYDWERMAQDGYAFWRRRLRRTFEQVDVVRIDHFRAFAAYWAVPAGAPDARGGRWVEGPGRHFFDAMRESLGEAPIIAEDLGIAGPEVHALLEAVGFPGMAVLQFAFGGGADNAYLPHNHVRNAVVYPGTHDNDTTVGWWGSADESVRDHVRRYLRTDGSDIADVLCRAALGSVARTAILPLQDILALGGDARMNVPGRAEGNWTWRVRAEAFNRDTASALRERLELYGRLAER
ncbi:MAG: 4-alpha-glucanotransferase [Deltaproteobacteria bacterium]|nr:4-alpha-glucanotransferase [Deltaproteobacteria bacterium]